MRRLGTWVAVMLLLAAPGARGQSRPPAGANETAKAGATAPPRAVAGAPAAKGARPARGPRFTAVTFRVRHRVFHEFRDVQTVKLNQEFPLGDTQYSARVVRYLPDFQMDLQARKFFSLSDQPRNPAFQVIVKKNGVPEDTSWAFFNSPPHFGARSYFAFQVYRIDFADHAPMVADSTTRRPPAMPAAVPAPRDSVAR